MPIYEYRCRDCGQISEIMVGIGGRDEPLKCQNCSGTDLERLISPSFVSMEGSHPDQGLTCCGQETRCDSPPCSGDNTCWRG